MTKQRLRWSDQTNTQKYCQVVCFRVYPRVHSFNHICYPPFHSSLQLPCRFLNPNYMQHRGSVNKPLISFRIISGPLLWFTLILPNCQWTFLRIWTPHSQKECFLNHRSLFTSSFPFRIILRIKVSWESQRPIYCPIWNSPKTRWN